MVHTDSVGDSVNRYMAELNLSTVKLLLLYYTEVPTHAHVPHAVYSSIYIGKLCQELIRVKYELLANWLYS